MPNQPSAAEFVYSVVRLQPKFTTFDCDGTLWTGDAGEGFFDWELRRKVVSDDVIRAMRARYADYRAGKVSEDDMCGEMVTLHRGLRESEVKQLAEQYFEENIVQNIFPEMRAFPPAKENRAPFAILLSATPTPPLAIPAGMPQCCALPGTPLPSIPTLTWRKSQKKQDGQSISQAAGGRVRVRLLAAGPSARPLPSARHGLRPVAGRRSAEADLPAARS
jgi:hypothetical protein